MASIRGTFEVSALDEGYLVTRKMTTSIGDVLSVNVACVTVEALRGEMDRWLALLVESPNAQ